MCLNPYTLIYLHRRPFNLDPEHILILNCYVRPNYFFQIPKTPQPVTITILVHALTLFSLDPNSADVFTFRALNLKP